MMLLKKYLFLSEFLCKIKVHDKVSGCIRFYCPDTPGNTVRIIRNTQKKLDKASVIILDEWGYVPYDRTGAQLLFDYLSEIHEQKSIILNTNLEFSRWVNVLYDEQMTAALVGRLTHHCHLLLFPGENNRLRESSIN